jgi:hypothetical protein
VDEHCEIYKRFVIYLEIKGGMNKLIAFVLAIFVCYVDASVVENNETNVAVYVNHLSSCNLNHNTGNMLCINQDYNTVIQYHDVKQVAMCPYHYCVLFNGDVEYSCTGYVLTLIGGKMDTHLNPLTPNTSFVGFTGNPNDDHIEVGHSFLGYNILINYFEQNVVNHSPVPIDSVECMDPYSTRVRYQDGSFDVFGAHGIVFRGMVESLLLGVVIHSSIAFTMYLFTFSFCKCGRNNICIDLFLVPLVTFLSCYMILFVAKRFVIKVLEFIISSIFGILFGFIPASIFFNSIVYCRKKNAVKNRVDIEESRQFVIDTDDDDDDGVQMTEIQLNEETVTKT